MNKNSSERERSGNLNCIDQSRFMRQVLAKQSGLSLNAMEGFSARFFELYICFLIFFYVFLFKTSTSVWGRGTNFQGKFRLELLGSFT